jgi:hypothetical protein
MKMPSELLLWFVEKKRLPPLAPLAIKTKTRIDF